MPPSLPHLPPAFLSTAASCSPMTAPPRRARRVWPHHPTAAVASSAATACALSPGQCRCSPRAAQPPAHCHPPSPPRMHSQIPLCRAWPAWLPCLAESACCKRIFERFRCFRYMLQVFQMDVTKVVPNVADVSMVVHYVAKVCYQCFIYVFRTYVVSVFIWMLHMFYTYVATFLSRCCVCLQWFSSVFRCFFQVFQKPVSSVSYAFRRMLQLLHLDVLNADRLLYLSSSPSIALSRCVLLLMLAGHPYDAVSRSFPIGGAVPSPLIAQAAWAERETECHVRASV
jgi:hypothetical protein